MRRLQEQAAAAASQQENTKNGHAHDAVSPTSSVHSSSSPTLQPALPHSAGSPYLESSMNHLSPNPNGPISPSRYPIAADTYHPHYPGMHDLRSSLTRHRSDSSASSRPIVTRTSTGLLDTQSLRSPSDALNTYPLYNWSSAYKHQQSVPIPPPTALPPLSYYYRPHRLEDVAPPPRNDYAYYFSFLRLCLRAHTMRTQTVIHGRFTIQTRRARSAVLCARDVDLRVNVGSSTSIVLAYGTAGRSKISADLSRG